MKRFVIFSFYIFYSLVALSQPTGMIQGKLFCKKNNSPIPFATVLIEGKNQGTLSDSLGKFTLSNVPFGFVRLQVVALGYISSNTSDIMINNTKPHYIEIGLDESVESLSQAVVTQSIYQRSAESPVSLRQLGQAEIEKSAGANRDVSRVLQTLPGVSFTSVNRNDVIVRGGGSNENRFFLDGVELPYINHFTTQGASGGVVGILNPDFIKGLNFYSGAFPSSKGNALSSVLDFKQIDGNSERTNFRATVGASDLAFTVNGPVSKNTTVIASLRRSYLQFLFSALGLPFLPTYNDFQFKVKTKLDSKNELTFIGVGALDNNRLNTSIKNMTPEQTFILNYLPESRQWTYTLGAVFKHYNKNGSDMFILSRNMLKVEEYKYPFNDESQPRISDYSSTESENKFRYEKNIEWGSFKLNTGGGIEYARYTNSTFRKQFRNNVIDTTNYDNVLGLFKWGVFSQLSRDFLEKKLLLSFGFRLDASSYSSRMNNLFHQFSPRFAASYVVNSSMLINFNLGRYYQLPPYTSMGYGSYLGTPLNKDSLTYISSDHIVIGTEIKPINDLKITLEGFYKHYRNYPFSIKDSVVLAAKGGADYGAFGDEALTSIGEGRAYGVELLIKTFNLGGFNSLLSYTLFWSEYKEYSSNLQSTGRYIPSTWDNRHLISLMVNKVFKRNWTAGARWSLSASTPYTPFDLNQSSLKASWDVNNRPVLDYSRFNQNRLGAYHRLDVRFDKTYYFDRWSLNFYVDIQNLYNFKVKNQPNYVAVLGDDGRPMTDPNDPSRYQMQELTSKSGTILPTLGIMIQF